MRGDSKSIESESVTDLQEQNCVIRAQNLVHEITSGDQNLRILDRISLDILVGESVAIVGRSGSGKTTLLSMLAGLDQPTHGRVELAGADLSGLDEDDRARLRAGRVGFVFQSFQLLGGFSAFENARLGAELAGHADASERARKALDQVGLRQRTSHFPHQLSGGEQQRVAIARAFAAEPTILFADEPTGNLDGQTGDEIVELLFGLNRDRQTTLVLVTHDEGLASRCDRRLSILDGRLV